MEAVVVGVAAAGGGKGRGKARLLSSARERVRSRESSARDAPLEYRVAVGSLAERRRCKAALGAAKGVVESKGMPAAR
jgi:hypothetical protein